MRATAEPMLNSWVAKLLGNPKKVRCTVEMLDGTGAVVETRKLAVERAEPCAARCGVWRRAIGVPAGQVSELEQHVLYQARLGTDGFPQQARLAHPARTTGRSRRAGADVVGCAGAGAGGATAVRPPRVPPMPKT